MRILHTILFFSISLLILQSCGEKSQPKEEAKAKVNSNAYTFELLMFDTINKTDGEGLKQGKWIIRKLPGNIVIESGVYKDNLKQGCWVRHGMKGEFIDSIYYKNDLPTN
jgi:hypothetical protein